MPDENAGGAGRETSKTAGENWLVHMVRAAGYSLEGLGAALRHEMAFRMEAAAFAVLGVAVALLPVGLVFKALVIGSMLLVLVVELLNSALEWVVDYISRERHPYAKRAKDMGSAAVLLALVNAGLMWLVALLQWGGFSA